MARSIGESRKTILSLWGPHCDKKLGFSIGILLLLTASLRAGPIFVAGQWKGGQFIPAPEASVPWYTVRYSDTTVHVQTGEKTDEIRVETSETIVAPEKAVQAVGFIPLPEGAKSNSVRWQLGEAREVQGGQYLTSDQARKVCETLARQSGNPKFLAYIGRPAVLLPQVHLQGKVTWTLSYLTVPQATRGIHSLTCPMPAAAWSREPVARLALKVTLRAKDPLRAIFSPTHSLTIQRQGLNEATATVKADKWTGTDDFRLFWVADPDDLGLRVLAYRGQDKEDGFFMLLGNPTGTTGAERVVDKDVLFVLDSSGSMRGEKIEQARSAIDYCLDHLNPGDRFNIITFGTEVRSLGKDLKALVPASLAEAREFIENVVANGQTNICAALEKAVAGPADPARPRIMIFLTDGAPTAGVLLPEKILDNVKKANTSLTRIFVMGVGHDVNAHLLDKLAEMTEGSSEYVGPKEELDAKIASLYDHLSHPVLSGVSVSFGDLTTHSVCPQKLPVLFRGSEIMMVGRYRDGGKHTFTIAGTLFGKPVKYTVSADLPRGTAEPAHEFLAPLWAARKIGYLLQEIRLNGEVQELIEEVVRLSRQYGIVTEYTEFLALGGKPVSGEEAVREAKKRLSAARAEQAGQWAVNQAFNDRALQNRAVATGTANVYRDRRGQVMAANNISQIGRRAFYLKDGQWIDAEDPGTRKTRVVQLFSKEYFDLLRSHPDFARAQQLGWALSINVGPERIVLEKNGKQQDEALRVKPEPAEEVNQEPDFNRLQQIPQNRIPLRNQRKEPGLLQNQKPPA